MATDITGPAARPTEPGRAPAERQPAPRPPDDLLELCEDAEALLRELGRAFTHYDRAALGRAERLAARVHAAEKALTATLLRTPWAFLPGHLERIGDQAETILRCVRIILDQGVPFSDRAVGEVEDLLGRGAELLRLVRDVLATQSRFLLQAVARESVALAARANRYAEAHEARLVEGVCVPRASSLFLAIVDSLRAIEWHVREIAERVAAAAPGKGAV
jgi:Na+/phosphate symporter